MQRIILLLLSIILSIDNYCQLNIDTTIKLDLLKSPASPAFNILGISLNEVERPTDLSSFTLSLQEATNNFTTIPQSYAFQIAPFLLGKRKYSLLEFDKGDNAFKQSFLISAGFTHMGPEGKEDVDSLKTTKIGLGLKFSIVRPHWSTTTRTAYRNLVAEQKKLLQAARDYEKNHPKKMALETKKKRLKELEKDQLTQDEIAERQKLLQEISELDSEIFEGFTDELPSTEIYDKTKKAALAFKTERYGFFLDFSGGFALNFPDNRFNNSKAYRGGAWLTGGHENGNQGISSLFIIRYLYHPESVFADPSGLLEGEDASTFDAGGKLLLDLSKENLSFSGEAIYRSVLGKSVIDPSWRLVLNAEYNLGANRKLTFAFGRDFDGTISKAGNLIAAINFIAGFGNDRKISD
jgi:hypothetical protein